MIQEAATAGHAPAMECMGDLVMLKLYTNGRKYREIIPRAHNWYRQALNRGRPTAGHKIIKELAWRYSVNPPPEIIAEKARIQEQLNALPEAKPGIEFKEAVRIIQAASRPVEPK